MPAEALHVVESVPKPAEPLPLRAALAESRAKIAEDLIRFRTCCADPRASK